MKPSTRYIMIVTPLLIAAALLYFRNGSLSALNTADATDNVPAAQILPETRTQLVAIESGDTYSEAMARGGLDATTTMAIYEAAKESYDLANIRAGYSIELVYGYSDDILREVVYKFNTEQQLRVTANAGSFAAVVEDIPYEVKVITKEGKVESSLYQDAIAGGIDERAIIDMADAFQWTIDFAMDPRVGDTFRFIYEERYLDGEYIRPGRMLAAEYMNDGKQYRLFYFDGDPDNAGYFDEEGNSVQKMFLKAPVAFKYISSGFTTGQRYVEAFNVSTGHRAIDYAAPSGTPIRSVGDGTVSFAAWNGSYGNMVKVRHNGTYSTNYGHMSKIAVKSGQKVAQGDIIGYVGSTGFSTGPHLHYEMVKNGVKVNPLLEVLPPGESLTGDLKANFLESIKAWQAELDR